MIGARGEAVRAVRLTLMVRGGCHLCELAEQAMERVARRTGEPWSEVDITGDPALEAEYGLRVPVVLLDGKEHGYWKVEEDRLERDLARPAGRGW